MSLVVGVRFADAGKLYYFDPGPLDLETGEHVLVETPRGMELGEVVLGPREVEDTTITSSLKRISKRADDRDFRRLEQNVQREENAFQVCEEKIRRRGMPMKLIDVEYAFDGSKLIFYFAAEGRVDFRELVKDLASVFRTRIELRQIGVRDEAKKIGGLGPCGRPACCNAFLDDFVPVSIKMAKEQNLSLSPTKISGLCGRLMCCLHYEHEHYRDMHRQLPRVGTTVQTPDGPAEVMETDPLCGRIKGRITLSDGSLELRKYSLEEISTNVRREAKPAEQPSESAGAPARPERRRESKGAPRRERRTHGKVGRPPQRGTEKDKPEERKAAVPSGPQARKRHDRRRPPRRTQEAKGQEHREQRSP